MGSISEFELVPDDVRKPLMPYYALSDAGDFYSETIVTYYRAELDMSNISSGF